VLIGGEAFWLECCCSSRVPGDLHVVRRLSMNRPRRGDMKACYWHRLATSLLLLSAFCPVSLAADISRTSREHSDDVSSGDIQQASAASRDEVLDEVLVAGDMERALGRRAITAWLRRLPGKYVSEGKIHYSSGLTILASGTLDCVGFGSGPGVRCEMRLAAPGGNTNMEPGMFLLGMDIESALVRFMTVDDLGYAAGDTGELRGDTATFRSPCAATVAAKCLSTTWILVERPSDKVYYRVDISLDGQVTARIEVTHTNAE
jgi:hypothetical protein